MTTAPEEDSSPASGADEPVIDPNPLLAVWSGSHGGVPPFDLVEVRHFEPALYAAMQENLAEVERIASDSSEASFENTLLALERSGRMYERVTTVFGVWSSAMSGSEFQQVELEMAPRLASFADQITQNSALFERIEAVYKSSDTGLLTPEQRRLAWLYHTNFVHAGARLDSSAKARLSEINQALAAMYTRFAQNVLADETDHYLVLHDEAELDGLPQSARDGAAVAARDRGITDGWVIANSRSAIDPLLTYSSSRELREKGWRLFMSRGDMGGAHDNNEIISEILALRSERAILLGYPTHAHWHLDDTMAKTPERAASLLEQMWLPAVSRVKEEIAAMQELARSEQQTFQIEPWDYRYYAEKVRKLKYDLDQNEVKAYLQLEKLREGMFWVAGELLGFLFTAVEVPVYHPDVRVWEVTDRSSGTAVGLWYFDPYARLGKQSGAWMNSFRSQETFEGGITPIVSNNSNFVEGRQGEPVLISWDDARTLFHEFGHALHGLASSVTYPALSGTAVARDYVEFPSQLLEHWLVTPEVLQRFAAHYETGEPIPRVLVDRIEQSLTFNQGFDTIEYLGSALMDMKMHLATGHPIDPRAFERDTLATLGMPHEVSMRHRSAHFLHVFSSDGYSAGYYSYLWADVLTADAWQAFMESSGPYDAGVAANLRDRIFSAGNTVDPAEAYRSFRGRDPGIEALMQKRGFLVKTVQLQEIQA